MWALVVALGATTSPACEFVTIDWAAAWAAATPTTLVGIATKAIIAPTAATTTTLPTTIPAIAPPLIPDDELFLVLILSPSFIQDDPSLEGIFPPLHFLHFSISPSFVHSIQSWIDGWQKLLLTHVCSFPSSTRV